MSLFVDCINAILGVLEKYQVAEGDATLMENPWEQNVELVMTERLLNAFYCCHLSVRIYK